MSGSVSVATISLLNNWPGCVCYFSQRKVFAGSNQVPTGIWLTQPGNYHNMNISVVPRDDDAITETISAPPPGASAQVNKILHMVPMPSGLLVFSSGGAWQITAGQANAALTASTITANAHAFSGISDRVAPLAINYEILFVQEKGSIVRDMSYNFYMNIFTGTDLSALANHLFFGRKIVSWCWAEEPHKLLYAARDDGVVLCLTFLKEQEISAWSWFDTQGIVEDVASVSENGQHAVYMIVRRFIGGAWKRFVERVASRDFGANPQLNVAADPALAWCVDCGLSYSRVFPQADIAFGASTGVTLVATDADAFVAGDEGKVIRGGGGLATITQYLTARTAVVSIIIPIAATLPDDPDAMPLPLNIGQWSCTRPITTVTGLSHLEGKLVSILADGNVVTPQRVVGGQVVLPVASTAVVVGLPFTWQLQTLPSNAGGGQPTTKGRRKLINTITLLLHESRGVWAGPTFADLVPVKDRPAAGVMNGQAAPLVTGEVLINISSTWSVRAQFCLQGTDPVPATILAVVPEIVVGDT